MADERPGRTGMKNLLELGRENSKSFRLPKSDVPSVPESWVKPGSDKPT